MRGATLFTALLVIVLAIATMRCDSQRMAPSRTAPIQQNSAADPYTPHLPARAHDYHRASRILFLIGIGWHVLGLVLFLRSGASAACRDVVESLARQWTKTRSHSSRDTLPQRAPPFLAVGGYYLLYATYVRIWSLPISLSSLAIERQFGFSNETIALFAKDSLLNLFISQAMIPIIWLGYMIYARKPRTWWLYVWAAIVPVTFVVTVVYPVMVAPLFNRYTPLAAGTLRENILALAAKSGIHNGRVFVEDTSRRTSHVNAYVTGLGPTTRIVLNDTALRLLPQDQILAIVGHEMGHYVERHVLIGVATGAVGTGLLLALLAVIGPRLVARCGPVCRLRGPRDLAALPAIMLTIYVVTLLSEPISSAISRELEHRADVYGLRMTGLGDATARLMVGFAERDLSDPDPPPIFHWWFGTHPTLSERIAYARKFGAGSHMRP